MRSSCALVLPALVCISCASAPATPPVESPRLPGLAQHAQAASRTGPSERAAFLWEQVLAANPSGAVRTLRCGAPQKRSSDGAGLARHERTSASPRTRRSSPESSVTFRKLASRASSLRSSSER